MLSPSTMSHTKHIATTSIRLLCRRRLRRREKSETVRSDHRTHDSRRQLAVQQVAAEGEWTVPRLFFKEGFPALRIERVRIAAGEEGSVKEPSSSSERICIVKRGTVVVTPIGGGECRQEACEMSLQPHLLCFAETCQQCGRAFVIPKQRAYRHFAAEGSRRRRRSGEAAGERTAPASSRRDTDRGRARSASPERRHFRSDREREAGAA